MTELALELQALGHKVTVLTATPHYNVEPQARAKQPLERCLGGILYQSNYQGIRVYHASVPVKGSRVRVRLLDYTRFHAISIMAGLTIVGGYDVVLAPSPPLTIGFGAWLLGLMRQVPFIYNVQEIYPDLAVELGILKNQRMIQILLWLERFIYARARVVVVISEWFHRRLLTKGLPTEKLRVIPNFVDTDFMQPGQRHNDFSASYNLDDHFVVLYTGNIGLTQGFETVLAAAQRLTRVRNFCFLIIGDGTRKVWLQEQLAQAALPNVTLLPYQPRSLIPQIYASSDVCLVPLKREMARDTFPSKIYTIMAAGRPVIASAEQDTELAWVIEEAKCGTVVEPDNPEALAAAIERSYHQKVELYQLGQNGRAYVVAHHSRQVVARQYDALIRQIISDG